MDYQLYIANKDYSSWSMRPWVLMTACDIAFEEIMTPFAGTAVQHAFKEFSPTGKVPCFKNGDVLVWIPWPSPSTWQKPTRACGQRIERPVPGHARHVQKCIRGSWPYAMNAR